MYLLVFISHSLCVRNKNNVNGYINVHITTIYVGQLDPCMLYCVSCL